MLNFKTLCLFFFLRIGFHGLKVAELLGGGIEAVARMCSVRKVLLTISQYAQENTCKHLQHGCIPMNIGKCLRRHILKNICKRLLLEKAYV